MLAWAGTSLQNKTDRERDGFSGQVYAVREATPSVAEQKANAPSGAERHTTSYYAKDGALIFQLDYVGGRMVKRLSFRHTSPGEIMETTEDGGVDSSAEFVGPNPPPNRVIRHSLKFDSDGNLTEEHLFGDDGKPVQSTTFKRDGRGRAVEVIVNWHGGNSHKDRTTYEYRDGNEPASSTYQVVPGRSVTQHFSYELDSRGNWTTKREQDSGYVVKRTIAYYGSETGASAGPSTDGIPGESPNDPLQPIPLSGLPKVVRKSGGVLQASAIRKVEPAYPMSARSAHITGSVVVEIRIDHSGTVVDAKAINGPRELQDAAVEAARQWRFQPTSISGVRVDVVGTITFNFMQ
jgi:TonB family protein